MTKTPQLSKAELQELARTQPAQYYGKREIETKPFYDMIHSGAIQVVKQYKNTHPKLRLHYGMYVIADMEVFDKKLEEYWYECEPNFKKADPNYVPTLYVEQFIR